MIRIKELINTMSDRERLDAVILIEHGMGKRYNKKTMPEMFAIWHARCEKLDH